MICRQFDGSILIVSADRFTDELTNPAHLLLDLSVKYYYPRQHCNISLQFITMASLLYS